MSAVSRWGRRAAVAAVALLVCAPAVAVGFGPLVVNGMIDGPRKGFQLDLVNSESDSGEFIIYAIGLEDETPQPRVSVLAPDGPLGPNRTRKVLIVADALEVGETYKFRVCAERKPPSEGIMIHARVCSKLSARRVS